MSHSIDDGGQAFPVPSSDHHDRQEGMTLRDWFAGQAMAAMPIVLPLKKRWINRGKSGGFTRSERGIDDIELKGTGYPQESWAQDGPDDAQLYAHAAYKIADAMIAAQKEAK